MLEPEGRVERGADCSDFGHSVPFVIKVRPAAADLNRKAEEGGSMEIAPVAGVRLEQRVSQRQAAPSLRGVADMEFSALSGDETYTKAVVGAGGEADEDGEFENQAGQEEAQGKDQSQVPRVSYFV
jgi:hypothetical protein